MLPLKFCKQTFLSSVGRAKQPVTQAQQTYVQPCVINNQPHIIYPRGLATTSPLLFQQLSGYFLAQGYQLKEDQRYRDSASQYAARRRAWAPIVLFTVGLFFESSVNADVEIDITDRSDLDHTQVELNIISNEPIRQQIREELHVSPFLDRIEDSSLKNRSAQVLFDILISRYQASDSDPAYITSDLQTIAEYFSSFPEVITLFNSIKDANWTLVYDENNWTTIASGNAVNIDKTEIHFNTRSAAQLRLNDSCKQNPVCIASPADALLHELLHVHSIFNDTENFLAQGGMNQVLYPYQHERNIIHQERQLYKKMSSQDDIKRPYRHSHAGRIVKANCATCIK